MPYAADMCSAEVITVECHGSSVSVHKFGATVVSWKVGGEEKLFVSSKAIWDGSKPIRGGIPLVFPQFGTGPICPGQHGFARNQPWEIEKIASDVIICRLNENDYTLKQWPHKFNLVYTVKIEPTGALRTKFCVGNPSDGSESFVFACLLHTYFAVGNVDRASVTGLAGLEYNDKLLSGAKAREDRHVLTISGEVDRTYLGVPDRLELRLPMGRVELCKKGFKDAVLWNPWVEKAKAMTDFGEEEYKEMVCIEFGSVSAPVTLRAGESWEGEQLLAWSPQ